ncbi:protein disulfide isomerase [Histomonas meleagridis]|uniref:protein disulfide isomerase n=1 Tax=Histomonas meleagridis TaxID=135588 RepID=UPI00355A45F8|nr:protein disulfide isomerase [Histomonas meleagridis]KAH0802527.1 protein disulfide isomerase [Histomonas meleagridis]
MLFLLLHTTFSIHIPYLSTAIGFLPSVEPGNFEQIASQNKHLIVLVISDKINDFEWDTLKVMVSISPEFLGDAYFGVMYESGAGLVLSKGDYELPCVAHFYEGNLTRVSRIPDDISQSLFLFRSWIYDQPTVKSLDSLKAILGHLPLTIFSKETNYNECLSLLLSHTYELEQFEIINISESLFKELELTDHKFGVYRADDNIIESFDDFNSFQKAMIPKYKQLQPRDIIASNSTFAVILDYDYNEEYKQLLYELSHQFTEFKFGFISESLFQYYSICTNQKVDPPSFWVFNYKEGYYYEYQKGTPFKQYLSDVREGKLQKQYISESEDQEENNEIIHKLVGKSYAEFVNDPEHDVVVLYGNPAFIPNEIEDFKNIAEQLKETSIKFAYINIDLNTSPKPFPSLKVLPHVHMFTKNNKEGIYMWSHFSSNNLLRFICKYATENVKVKPPQPSYDEMLDEMNFLGQHLFDFPGENQEEIGKELDDLLNAVASSEPEKEEVLEEL